MQWNDEDGVTLHGHVCNLTTTNSVNRTRTHFNGHSNLIDIHLFVFVFYIHRLIVLGVSGAKIEKIFLSKAIFCKLLVLALLHLSILTIH